MIFVREARKWVAQAEVDLRAAEDSLNSGHYD
jgi:HEPN domain-containing protein